LTGIWKTKLARKIGALFAALSIYLGVISDIGGVWSFFKDFRKTNSQLVVIQGRLTALFRNPGYKKNRDDATLSIQVRNYGETAVTLTAASLSIEDGHGVGIARSGARNGCTLSSVRNENNPITLDPGQTRWITIGTNIDLKGVSEFLTDEKLSEVIVFEASNEPFSIAQLTYISDLNEYFKKAYGQEAKIKVRIASTSENEYLFTFTLAEGKDLHAKDGSLHHDWFIANWKSWKNIRSPGGYKCESNWADW